MSRRPLLLLFLATLACDPGTPAAPPPPPAAYTGPHAETLTQVDALVKSGKPVEGYAQLRRALDEAPAGAPGRDVLAERADRLAFLLGVTDGAAITTHNLAPPSVDPGRAQAVGDARLLYEQANTLRLKGEQQAAMEAYAAVLKAVDSKEDPELYWNAFQSLDELQPQAASREAGFTSDAGEEDEGEVEDGDEGDDSSEGPPLTGDRVKDARSAYLKAVALERAGQLSEAHFALRAVVSELPAGGDPQLAASARQHLASVESRMKAQGMELPTDGDPEALEVFDVEPD